MNDTLADALQKIAAGRVNAGPAAPVQPTADLQLPAAAEPPQALLPQPPSAPSDLPPLFTPPRELPSAFAAFQAIVVCPPEPVEMPVAAHDTMVCPLLDSSATPPPVSTPAALEPTASQVSSVQEKHFKIPASLRSLASGTAQTAASMQKTANSLNSASWSDRLRTTAALLLSVGMAWVVWTDLRQPATSAAGNTEETVDVDQLLKEFETADHHSHGHEPQIQQMLADQALYSEPPVMDLDEELAAPPLTTAALKAANLQRTPAATEVEESVRMFSEPAAQTDESAPEAVYPGQPPARTPPKAGSGRPLRFTGQIQPVNPPAIAN